MNDRIAVIDAVRGTALFGILVVNILAFASPYYGAGMLPPGGRTPLDATLAFAVSTVFELKFYLLFSFLFGYSVTLQIRSAEQAGASFLPRMLRRQTGLFLIGTCHALLLFHGDILTTYAILGLLLLALRGWSDTAKLRLASVLIAATALLWAGIASLQWFEPSHDETRLFLAHVAQVTNAYRGSPATIMAQHAADAQALLPMLVLLQAPCALAMFLLGFVAGDRRVLEQSERYRSCFRKATRIGLSIGLPGGILYAAATQFAPGTTLETAGLASSILTAPFLTMALATMLIRFFETRRAGRWRMVLAFAGRMALTNYLGQSIACALIFHGYGLGLIGRLSVIATLAVAILIFAAQLIVSRWWLRHHTYGPVEWVLRAMTIGNLPPWRSSVR